MYIKIQYVQYNRNRIDFLKRRSKSLEGGMTRIKPDSTNNLGFPPAPAQVGSRRQYSTMYEVN